MEQVVERGDNESIIRGLYDTVNSHNLEALRQLGDANTVCIDVPFSNMPFKGQNALFDIWKGWVDIFPDANLVVKSIIVSGDNVVVQGLGRGTQKNVFRTPMGDLAATGKYVELPFCEVFQLREGKILSFNSYFDLYTMLGQLGFNPKIEQLH